METIHIYDKNKKINSIWTSTIEEFQTNPQKYYPNWEEGYVATSQDFINPIFENGELREMTREEMVLNGIEVALEPGETIEDGKIIKKEKPQTGLTNSWKWNGSEYIYDISEARQSYFKRIDEIKAKSLAFGFEYEVDGVVHRQRCRDKDETSLGISMTYLMGERLLGNNSAKSLWVFEDNYKTTFDFVSLMEYSRICKAFVESIYLTENFFKVDTEPKNLTEEEFEKKRAEFHKKLIKG